LVFNNNYRGGTGNACNKISFYGGGNTPTANNNGVYGIGVEFDALEYFSNGGHAFFTNSKGGTTLGDERMRIASNGNIGIGTNNPGSLLDVVSATPIITIRDSTNGFGKIHFGNSGHGVGRNAGVSTFTGGNDVVIWTAGDGSVGFCTNSLERMRINNTGVVTINSNNYAGCRLVLVTEYDNVNSSFRIDSSNNTDVYSLNISSYVSGGGEVGWRFRVKSAVGGNNNAIQIANTGSVYFAVGSSSASDSRIKKDIDDINDDTALTKLLLIQPKTYNYIADERNKGFGKVYGFIAQQIREVIPEAVTIIKKETIPNIYKSCLINNKREVYHSIPLDTPIDTSIKIDSDSYKIKEIYEDYFVIDNDIEADEVFVFGYSVDDFHTLNKDYIFTLNVCATQELHRRIEAQSLLIKSQDDRIKDLEMKMERMLSGTT
jgi:hypothetical protein